MGQDQSNAMDFDEYIRQGEPGKKEKASIWQTAIGSQAVDGLQTSDYLRSTARKHIEGEIDIEEVRSLIKSFYQYKTRRNSDDDGKQEADKVSANIGSPDIVRGKHYLKYQRNTVEIPQRCVPLQYEKQHRHKHVQGACLIHPS